MSPSAPLHGLARGTCPGQLLGLASRDTVLGIFFVDEGQACIPKGGLRSQSPGRCHTVPVSSLSPHRPHAGLPALGEAVPGQPWGPAAGEQGVGGGPKAFLEMKPGLSLTGPVGGAQVAMGKVLPAEGGT